MWKSRLTPREFRFRAGARTELDQAFLKIINNLPPDINLSEFLKNSVVENELHKQELSEAERLMADLRDSLDQIFYLKQKLARINLDQVEPEQAGELKKYQIFFENVADHLERL